MKEVYYLYAFEKAQNPHLFPVRVLRFFILNLPRGQPSGLELRVWWGPCWVRR